MFNWTNRRQKRWANGTIMPLCVDWLFGCFWNGMEISLVRIVGACELSEGWCMRIDCKMLSLMFGCGRLILQFERWITQQCRFEKTNRYQFSLGDSLSFGMTSQQCHTDDKQANFFNWRGDTICMEMCQSSNWLIQFDRFIALLLEFGIEWLFCGGVLWEIRSFSVDDVWVILSLINFISVAEPCLETAFTNFRLNFLTNKFNYLISTQPKNLCEIRLAPNGWTRAEFKSTKSDNTNEHFVKS